MKMSTRYTAVLVATIAAVFAVILCTAWSLEFRPEKIGSAVSHVRTSGKASCFASDTVTVVGWNIGYAGYDDSMDFFYDGGTRVRQSREKTEENLRNIVSFIRSHSDADFILLQEADLCSRRSYHMNFMDSIKNTVEGVNIFYAPNFRCSFVPIPFREPIGKVESGLMIITRHTPVSAIRLSLPGSFPWPERIFNLKRCVLEMSFLLPQGDTLWISDIHNSAFDDGEMRREELKFISNRNRGRKYGIIIGDWNSNPPQYSPSQAEISNRYFSPIQLSGNEIEGFSYAADLESHTMRYLDKPYSKGESTESLLDFAAISKGILCDTVRTFDLGFRYSDHNPVFYRFTIDKSESVADR